MPLVRFNQPILTNLTPHQGNRRVLIPKRRGGGSGDSRLAFHALENRQGVIKGEGALSASTGSTTIYAPDASGVYRPFTDEPVWEGVDWLKYQPLATNGQIQSRTYSAWSPNSVTVVADQTGIDGTANMAWTLTATGSDSRIESPANASATTRGTVKVWIEKNADHTNGYPAIGINSVAFDQIHIDTVNGTLAAEDGGTSYEAIEIIDAVNWWIVCVQYAMTSGRVRVSPARATILGGPYDSGATGSCVVGQVEWHGDKTIAEVRGLGPIFTTTDAAGTARTIYNWDVSNLPTWSGNIGCHYAEIRRLGDGAGPSNQHSFLDVGVSNPSRNILSQLGATFRTSASDNSGPVALAMDSDTNSHKHGAAHDFTQGAAQLNHNYDGTWQSPDFALADGSFYGSASFGVMHGNDGEYQNNYVPVLIRNVRRYNVTTFEEGKDIIDGLMA